jgi:ABC-type Fe3+/spermidine/putrescine transport system ATPase subunit
VAFGLRMRGVPRAVRRRRVGAMLDLVRLPDLAGRRVGELFGGQEQRVALARALLLDPQVLLLDEPFSQLDANLRVGMRELVHRVQRELGITTLFVMHDQQEAVDLADTVALMIEGRIEAHGPPRDFYTRPATLRAARFPGSGNEVPGTLAGTTFTCVVRCAAGVRRDRRAGCARRAAGGGAAGGATRTAQHPARRGPRRPLPRHPPAAHAGPVRRCGARGRRTAGRPGGGG